MKEQSTLKTDLLFKIASVDRKKKRFFNIIKENMQETKWDNSTDRCQT